MLRYIMGDGRLFRVDNSWGSSQVHQSQPGDDPGVFYQVKNSEWEEFYYDHDFIYRGVDVSMGEGRHYQLRDQPEDRFSKWSPRLWSVGDIYERNPIVTVYEADCHISVNQRHSTYLKLAAALPFWQKARVNSEGVLTPVGQRVDNVIVLYWLEDAEDLKPLEVYYYALDYGLVGFGDGTKPGGLESWIGYEYAPNEAQPARRMRRPCNF